MTQKPIVILYATREGQTARVAEHLAQAIERRGCDAQVFDVGAVPQPFDFGNYSAAVLAASVHFGRHEGEMIRFVREHRAQLDELPTAFISVSLAQAAAEDAARTREQRERGKGAAVSAIEHFCEATLWRPDHIQAVAGALLYTHYQPLVRLVMKHIAKRSGAPTDVTRDYEMTCWPSVHALASELVAKATRTARRSSTAA